MKKEYKKMLVQKIALTTLQRNLKAYIGLRNWPWWKLFTKMKPLLQNTKRAEEEAAAKAAAEAEAKRVLEEAQKREALLKDVEATNVRLLEEKNSLFTQLQTEKEERDKIAEKSQKLEMQKNDLESQVGNLEEKLASQEEKAIELSSKKKKLETEINDIKRDFEDLQVKMNKAENENKSKETMTVSKDNYI